MRPWQKPLTMTHPIHPRTDAPSPQEQAALLRAVAERGDHGAFAALFRHFAPRVKAFLMCRGLAAGLAEELTQEVMVNVWRKASSFDPAKAAVSTWIFTIARNLYIDFQRRGHTHPQDNRIDGEALLLETPDDAPSPFARVAGEQVEASVRAALDSLPREQASIVRLSFFEGLPHAAIAEALAIPLGTVKSRIRLAVNQLRQRLEYLK